MTNWIGSFFHSPASDPEGTAEAKVQVVGQGSTKIPIQAVSSWSSTHNKGRAPDLASLAQINTGKVEGEHE